MYWPLAERIVLPLLLKKMGRLVDLIAREIELTPIFWYIEFSMLAREERARGDQAAGAVLDSVSSESCEGAEPLYPLQRSDLYLYFRTGNCDRGLGE